MTVTANLKNCYDSDIGPLIQVRSLVADCYLKPWYPDDNIWDLSHAILCQCHYD